MKLLSLLVGSALTTLTLGTAAMAQDAVNPATLTCAEFLAMDAGGMAKASEAVDMADDAMAGDAMAGDTTARITAACTANPDAKVADALAM